MQDTQVRSLGWEDPLEKEMATHSSILAWEIPWHGQRSLEGYSPRGRQESGMTEQLSRHTHTHTILCYQELVQLAEKRWNCKDKSQLACQR